MSQRADRQFVLDTEMTVKQGSVPDLLAGDILFRDDYCQITNNSFRFQSLGGGALLIYKGRWYIKGAGITLQMDDPALEDEYRVYLMGTVFGAVAWLNGFLPIHASAVVKNGRAIAFTADSGGGKSTLAAGLSKLGYPHICDDTLILDPMADQVVAFPDRKPLKLWDKAFKMAQPDRRHWPPAACADHAIHFR